ncbi:MAG: glycosyltransferase family 9 protein [Gammaproteobacteria bacterium]|nr:glycosyltransferase family 9 protein [Gammaproteobacteria bacterium]
MSKIKAFIKRFITRRKLKQFLVSPLIIAYERFFFSQKREIGSSLPKKVLICNAAHLGDVVIATSILEPIKRYYPNVSIGFLTSSWSKPIIMGNPFVDHIHIIDHRNHSRRKCSYWQKFLIQYQTIRVALKEIKNINYDAVIDLYAYSPSFMSYFWYAEIPRRVGYYRSSVKNFFTDPKEWVQQDKHEARYHLDLIRSVFPIIPADIGLKPFIVKHEVDFSNFLPEKIINEGYILFHPGSGYLLKDWSTQKWIQLKEHLLALGYNIIITGSGVVEAKIAAQICADSTNCVNLCNKLKWDEFIAVIAQAKLLVGVDSLAGHVAAGLNTPSVIIFWGVVDYRNWQPLTHLTQIIFNHLPCVPCFKISGCKNMSCIRDVTVEQVLSSINNSIKLIGSDA